MSSVFISYNHSDALIANEIASALDDLNIEYFRDIKDISLGESIYARIREGILKASAIIVIVSPGSAKSLWVPFEVGFGVGRGKLVIPYITHPSQDVPGFISDRLYAKSVRELRQYFESSSNWWVPGQADTGKDARTTGTLSDLQVQYLMEISKPRNGGSVPASIDERTGREIAVYQEALELFIGLSVMKYGGDQYRLTERGWKLVDQLWRLRIADALEVDQYRHEDAIAMAVGLTDGEVELVEVRRHLDTLSSTQLAKIQRTNLGINACLTYEGATFRKHRPVTL